MKTVFIIPIMDPMPNFILLGEFNGILTISIIISIIIGSILSLFEQRIKRFIAYSSISQIGFLLVGFLGYGISLYSIQIILYFLFTYVFNLFFFIFILNFFCYRQNDIIGINYEKHLNYISDLYSLFFCSILRHQKIVRIFVGFVIIIIYVSIVFSFAGISLSLGFYGKLYIIFYLIEQKN